MPYVSASWALLWHPNARCVCVVCGVSLLPVSKGSSALARTASTSKFPTRLYLQSNTHSSIRTHATTHPRNRTHTHTHIYTHSEVSKQVIPGRTIEYYDHPIGKWGERTMLSFMNVYVWMFGLPFLRRFGPQIFNIFTTSQLCV